MSKEAFKATYCLVGHIFELSVTDIEVSILSLSLVAS